MSRVLNFLRIFSCYGAVVDMMKQTAASIVMAK